MLNEEVKAPRNNTSHSGPVKSLFLTLCSDDEVFSVVSLLDNKKATRKIAVNTKFIKHGKTVLRRFYARFTMHV